MENAHHADDAIMAYREAVGKSITAYREEIGEIIHAIPTQIFARLTHLRPNARGALLSVVCNGRTFITAWPDASGHQRGSPADHNYQSAKQIDQREAIRKLDELHELLSGRLQPALKEVCEAKIGNAA
jgi:hypothetical protein